MSVSTYFDMAAAQTVLKELYDGQTVQNMIYRRNPFFAMVKKSTDFVGKVYPQPIITAPSAGRSAVFATAQGNQTAWAAQEFMVTRKKDYSIFTIDNETMMASASDNGAFVKGIKTTADLAWTAIENSMCAALFRSGTGSIGQIGSITSGVITLANIGDVVGFEVNQAIQANATDGGTPRAAVGYVVAVNRMQGKVTVSTSLGGAAATPGSWAANDYLLVQGDNNAKMSGLAAWIPSTDPTTGDSFYGVDRSVDPVRLAGLRYDGSAESVEEAAIDACAFLDREGGSPSIAVTNPVSFAALEKSMGAKVQYVDMKAGKEGQIGFRGIQINAPGGVVTVLSDRSCQAQAMWLLTMETWELKSLGEAPHVLNYGDGQQLRVYNADAVEGRIGFYGNLVCNAPGWNAYVKLGA
jgi:hypothetical protein